MNKKIYGTAFAVLLLGLVFGSSSDQKLVLATTECSSPLIEICINNSVEPPYITNSTGSNGSGAGKSFVSMLSATI